MEIMGPAGIERASMEIISRELRERGITLPEEQAPVIRRVIHTTADFDYADTLFFTPDAVRRGIEAFRCGTVLVTDTNMALAGVSRPGLQKLGGNAVCFMADEDVARQAREEGVTRAVASVRKAVREHPGCVFAAGNAPTALLELVRQMEAGFRPVLVIGVPVGFVNVVEAKELLRETCLRLDVPAIIAMGRKGGSTVAAAVCNALIYEAAGLQEPGSRVPFGRT